MDPTHKDKLENHIKRIEAGIDHFLPTATTRPAKLHTAIRYSMEAGGKRIRPTLLLAASELFPAKNDPLPAAVAIECIHAYSLIHDDLPAIDNSDLRRGRPSCHARFGEATAILAGDSLLTHAFQLLAKHYALSPALAVQLTCELATASGSERLIGGQMEDIENAGNPIDVTTLHYIHENKTSSLIVAALKMGLFFSEPTESQLQQAGTAGHHIGMAFQIIDDILDAPSTSKALGKPVGNDATSDKSTYVALYGITGARAEAKKHTLAAIHSMETLGGDNRFLIEFIRSMENRID